VTVSAEHARRILVVEDDPHLAAGVVENLRAEGYAVESVADGRRALEWLAGSSCGLVVLDVMLPEVDGFTVCRTLRERGDNTPVLFLTARGDPADRVRGLEAGGDDYLAKPFHLQDEDLLERVWGYDVFPSTRTVDNFILRLRKRFERDPTQPRHFLTVWGVGYRFMSEDPS
jgi:DNA-binding response OmpR family regulator